MRVVLVNTFSLGFAAALVAIVADAAVAHRNIGDLADTSSRVAFSHQVQDALEKLLSTVKDAETGQRGYFITGEEPFLKPYEDAVTDVRGRLNDVRTLTADLPHHRQRLAELERLTDAKLAELAHTIDVYRTDSPAAARAIVRAGHGRQIMDELRGVVAAMQADEGALLKQRDLAAAASLRRAMVMNTAGGMLGAAVVGLAYFLFRRDLAAREQAAADLKRANDELEQRVQQRTEQLQRAADELSAEVKDRTRAEEQANALAAALQRSNRELQDFASVASHDLQEPLRKIQAFGDRLAATAGPALGEQGADYLKRMLHATGRMRTLINDLLAFTRVTTKAQPPAPVDLAAVAREVVSDLEGSLQQTGGRVELGELPTVEAEPTQMRQLVQNLVGNALKFHRPGVPPVVRVEGRVIANGEAAGGPPRCELTVSDNGIGFDEKYLDRIFTVFQRLHGRGEYEGTGMGLAIARKIAEQHGGTITARSRPGEGSTFVVTLPLPRPAPEEPS
jgi:signal transduction histidine kinase